MKAAIRGQEVRQFRYRRKQCLKVVLDFVLAWADVCNRRFGRFGRFLGVVDNLKDQKKVVDSILKLPIPYGLLYALCLHVYTVITYPGP